MSNAARPLPDEELLTAIASLQPAPLTLTLYIPTTAVGAVIGRRGQNITQLQKDAAAASSTTPVRISVVGHNDAAVRTYSDLDWSDPQWTPVVIRADPGAALKAATKIQQVVPQLDEVVMDIPVPRSRHAVIVGKRGLTLASLSAAHQVRIMVPSKELRHDVVQLEGDLDQVKQCYLALLRIAKGEEEATILVPQLPSHTKLRIIGRRTNTMIRKRKVDENTWQLSVTGAGKVHIAIAILQKWKEELGDASPTANPPPQRRKPQWPSGLRREKNRRKPPENATSTPTTTSTPSPTPSN